MTTRSQTSTLEAELPSRLLGEVRTLVEAGWYRNVDEPVADALRRFVETHRAEQMEELVRADVDWTSPRLVDAPRGMLTMMKESRP